MDRTDQENVIARLIKDLDDSKIVELHNDWCDRNNSFDDHIFFMGELDEILSGKTPTEIIDALASGFDTSDDYFTYGIYGVSSFDYLSDSNVIDYDKLAEYVIEYESLESLFDEDELKEEFLDLVISDSEPNRTKDDFEKALDKYDEYYGYCYTLDDDWSELESECIEIIDSEDEDENSDDDE